MHCNFNWNCKGLNFHPWSLQNELSLQDYLAFFLIDHLLQLLNLFVFLFILLCHYKFIEYTKTDFAAFIWEKLFTKNFSKFSLGNMCPFLCILLEFINWYCCLSTVNLSSVHFQCATLTWTCHPTCTHDMVTDHYNQLGRRPFASNC